jgi:hypothetical protein
MKSILIPSIVLFTFISCTFGQVHALPAQSALERFTIQAADGFGPSTGKLADVPGRPEAKGVLLPAGAGQYHCCEVDLKHTFSPGRYKIEYTLFAPGNNPAAIALYTISASNQHFQITYPRSCAPGQTQICQTFFFATRPFSRLGIKKMDKSPTLSQGVSQIVITDLKQKTYPRLEGYWTVTQYAAPWGLRSEPIESKLKKARSTISSDFESALAVLPEVESWLDRRSAAADLCGRADNLLRVGRLLNSSTSKSEVERYYTKAKDFSPDQLQSFEKSLNTFQADLENSAGGIVRSELGTDIFTWIKAWSLVGVDGTFEYSEPTPYQRKFMEPGQPVDLESTWTTSIYRGRNLTVTYSLLTPLITVDVTGEEFRFNFNGEKFQQPADFKSLSQKGWFSIASPEKVFLFVLNRKPKDIIWSADRFVIRFDGQAAVGYLKLSTTFKKTSIDLLALFYQKLLLKQPVQCVQIQKGNSIEQIFEYQLRPCDWPVKPLTIAPVPHLAMLSLDPKSKLRIKMNQPVTHTKDGWGYVNNSDRFRYQIPEIPRAGTFGINFWNDETNPDMYKEVRGLGCRNIRLICGAGSADRWDWKDLDPLRKRLQNNLQWAKDAGGLKVGIEMHGNWFPEGLNGVKGFSDPKLLAEFIKRWKQIIDWTKGYRDVVGWFDLQNEPDICYERESVKPYHVFMRKAVKALRPPAGNIPILVEACNNANPVGLQFWEDMGDPNIIVGYHDYWPHMFTHQRVVEPGDPAMPAVFYPSFMPMIEWTTPSWNNDSPNFHYWDRWKCDGISLPAFQLIIQKGCRLDCGEYGVVGYAGETSKRSGSLWLQHSMQRFGRLGINHNVYGYNGGFTWNVPEFKQAVIEFWKKQ